MDKKASQLASRFTLPPNSLGYCGKNTAPAKFISCVINGDCTHVQDELGKFIVLNPYLETLQRVTGQPKFAYENIEAYWLGNEYLKRAENKHYEMLLSNFTKQGVPDWLVTELRQKVPDKFIPHHLFQVLHVGVGKASGSVPYNLETINNCMVRWGKILKIDNGQLSINLNSLTKLKKFKLVKNKSIFDFREDFLPGLKVGDVVAVHWKQVVKILTAEEVINLDYWTREILRTVK